MTIETGGRAERGLDQPRLDRRKFVVGAGAAVAATAAVTAGGASPSSAGPPALPKPGMVPEPIKGGILLDPNDPNSLIHWFLPGPAGDATPVIGIPAMGLDVDPSTIGDFNGAQAYAVLAGTAKGSDGVTYDCEFDVRAMEGRYVDGAGVERRGAFAFMWVDLFVPGSGTGAPLQQVVDMQPGINPNGLFWTSQIPRGGFTIDRASRTATLRVFNYPLVESYQAFGPLANPGSVNIVVEWRGIGDIVERGSGSGVDPTDPAAFLGAFRDARAVGRIQGQRPGLGFRSTDLNSDGFYANMGKMRNGSYLP